jgi:hypothetical protein
MPYKRAGADSDPKFRGGKGLRGPDRQQRALRAVRPEQGADAEPEGLQRRPTDPINPHSGRGKIPPHVPGPKSR